MATITQPSDYTGEYRINKSCFDDLQLYIDKYEPYYLVRLLGADLKALFEADLTVTTPQVPQTSPYTDIFNPFEIDSNNCLYLSDGIKQMLVQLIYFHYTREQGHKNTQSGTVNVNAENSIMSLSFNDISSYNAGVSNYQIIQWYICDNPIDSAILDNDYNGIHLDFTNGI
tara:strand:+ start:143 stop:655 length:513 start_codon:yes stop_codon:yes gene_type:complete